ncbi:hypothetical protein C8R45DRAFT_924255 [Mycena sanguinolenta]|nr:hypothetical protein C8R45DRAFT_924255 [Mycena sanguinolenta]
MIAVFGRALEVEPAGAFTASRPSRGKARTVEIGCRSSRTQSCDYVLLSGSSYRSLHKLGKGVKKPPQLAGTLSPRRADPLRFRYCSRTAPKASSDVCPCLTALLELDLELLADRLRPAWGPQRRYLGNACIRSTLWTPLLRWLYAPFLVVLHIASHRTVYPPPASCFSSAAPPAPPVVPYGRRRLRIEAGVNVGMGGCGRAGTGRARTGWDGVSRAGRAGAAGARAAVRYLDGGEEKEGEARSGGLDISPRRHPVVEYRWMSQMLIWIFNPRRTIASWASVDSDCSCQTNVGGIQQRILSLSRPQSSINMLKLLVEMTGGSDAGRSRWWCRGVGGNDVDVNGMKGGAQPSTRGVALRRTADAGH